MNEDAPRGNMEVTISDGYIGPFSSDDDSEALLEIGRLTGNGDWYFNLVDPNQYLHGIRFPTYSGSIDAAFVGGEFSRLVRKLQGRESPPEYESTDYLYSSNAASREGTDCDDFSLEVTGIEGMGTTGEMFEEVRRFLDILVNRDESVILTLRNVDEDLDTPGETSAHMVFRPDGKHPELAKTFSSIARRAHEVLKKTR